MREVTCPAVTKSNIQSFRNYGIFLNEFAIIVAAIVDTNIEYFDGKLGKKFPEISLEAFAPC